MSINIQVLLSPGYYDRTMLEKIADGVLALPRAMWQGKEVCYKNFILTPEQTSIMYKFNLTRTMCWGEHIQNPLEKIGKTVVYGILTVVATPILFFGLALKNLALAANPKARAYSHIVQNTLDIDALKQKKCVLVERLNKILTHQTMNSKTYSKTYSIISDYLNVLNLDGVHYWGSRRSQDTHTKKMEFLKLINATKTSNKELSHSSVREACAMVEELAEVREDLHKAEGTTNNDVSEAFRDICNGRRPG